MRTYERDDDYSTIVLGTTRSPGVVTLSGHDRKKDWDVKAAKGQTGASSSLLGDPIGEFRASFYLADDEVYLDQPDEFERWDKFQAFLESLVAGPKPTAVPVYHPDLARNHFTEVTIKMIGGMRHDGRGGATVDVDFIEYKPPKPKPATKSSAKPGGRPANDTGEQFGPPYDPNAAAKAELAGLVAEARKP